MSERDVPPLEYARPGTRTGGLDTSRHRGARLISVAIVMLAGAVCTAAGAIMTGASVPAGETVQACGAAVMIGAAVAFVVEYVLSFFR